MVGHFAPPVHGMAVAFEALADAFAEQAEVVRLRTSPDGLTRSVGYHARRVGRWLTAIIALARLRARSRTLILSADAGWGMAYVIAAVAVARLLGYRIFVQHHSYAYIASTFPPMQVLARMSGGVTHLCSCPQMTDDLRRRYQELTSVVTLPLAYAVTDPANVPSAGTASAPRALQIGHFGNLTMAKGLGVALDTLDALRGRGVDAELVLAGPLGGPQEQQRVEAATAGADTRVRYVGPVYGPHRDEYLRGLDVLLFPSRYPHESFGLAFWESLRCGVPAIAYEAGCLTQELAGPGARVLRTDESFVDAAVEFIGRLHRDPASLAETSELARRCADESVRQAEHAVAGFVADICRQSNPDRSVS